MRDAFRAIVRIIPTECRREGILLLLVMLVNAGAELLGVASVLPIVAAAADPATIARTPWLQGLSQILGSPSPGRLVVYLGVVFLCLVMATNVLNATTYWLCQRFGLRVRQLLSAALLARYLRKPYVWFLGHHSVDLTKNVIDETDRLVDAVIVRATTGVATAIVAVFVCAALLWIQPVIALSTAIGLCLIYRWVYGFFRERLARLGVLRIESNSLRYRLVQQAIGTVKEARTHPLSEHFLERFRDLNGRYARLMVSQRLIGELPRHLAETLAMTAIVGTFLYLVATGHSVATVVPLAFFYLMATWRLVPALHRVYHDVVDVRFGLPLLEWMSRELGDPDDGPPLDHRAPRLELTSSIRLHDVSFRYPGGADTAVRRVTLEIVRGASLGLVGTTGAGKTTVADLVSGFLTPEGGTVEVDGVSIDRHNAHRWQKNVGYVPQEVFLLDDTVRRNIAMALADDQIDEVAVRRAARLAHIDELIESRLASGYDTVLGERGVCLSGGERQRIGIARALYHNPDVLILDEATSSLDNITERAVMEAIADLAGRKTLIVIAHRLTTVQSCDAVCLLERGEVVATGPYATLLATCPAMRALARLPDEISRMNPPGGRVGIAAVAQRT